MAKKKAKTARKPKAALPPASDAGPVGNSAVEKAASAAPVALEPYTVVCKVVWRGGDLWTSTETSRSFVFHDFVAEGLKRVSAKAQKKGYNVVLHKTEAVLTCNDKAKTTSAECGEPGQWEKLQQVIALWGGEKKKGITATLTFMYDSKPVEESESSEDEDEEEHDDEEIETTSTKRQLGTDSDDGEDTEGGYSQAKAANKAPPAKKQAKGKTPGRKTTTSKQIKKYEQRKAVDESMGNWGFELMARWKCDLPGCNKNKYCYQPYGRGGDHYPMNNDDITRWNREIQSDEDQFDLVSSEKPSQGLNETFLKRARIIRMATARKKEDKELTSPKTPCPDPAPPAPVAAPSMPSATTTPLTADEQLRWFKAGQEAAGGLNSGLFGQQASGLGSSLFPLGPSSLQQQLQMLQQLQQIQQFQGQLQQPLLPQIPALPTVNRQQIPSTPPRKLPSRPSTASQALSSPVKHSGDIDKALRDYIAWQCQRFPSQSERLEHAYEALSAEDYTLVDIQRFDDAKWKELSITYGIGARLRREIKEFQKAVAARAPLQTAPGLDILAEAVQSHGQNDRREC